MRLFAYWDRPESIPAYLQLCVATWQRHGGIDNVCLITDATLHDWVDEGVLDLAALREYPIPQRKDAIEIAVLARYGGIFIDLDTVCAAPLSSIRDALSRSEIALYGFHLSIVGAQRGSAVAQRWLELLQLTLQLPREQLMTATGKDYTELGNYCFELLRNELAAGKRAVPGESPPAHVRLWRKLQRHRMLTSPRQRWIAQIDPRSSGYIAEYAHRRSDKLSARQRYESFWFDTQLPLTAVTGQRAAMIGLHHSWTPPEYSAMGLHALYEDQRLLSRYLRFLLGRLESDGLGIFNTQNAVWESA